MKGLVLLVLCFFVLGCESLPNKRVHANREAEIEAAYNGGEITKKEYLDLKLRNDEIRFGDDLDVNVR